MRFDSLRERLLRAGVAPRHVQRFLRELQDHFDDVLNAELKKAMTHDAARDAAWARLGTEESLAQGMLARRELRSRAARLPGLLFGAAPAIVWVCTPIAILLAVNLLPEASRRVKVDATFVDAFLALAFIYTRVLPVLLGVLVLHVAAARRLGALWPLVGAGAVDVLAGTMTVYLSPGQLSVTSWLLPWLVPFTNSLGPRNSAALGEGLLLAALLLGLSLLLHRLSRRFGSAGRSTLTAA